jgi:osmotically-inducible protein OsmY
MLMVGQTRDTEQRVRQRLEEDPRTADHPIEVTNQSGFVSLGGRVPSQEVKAAAEAIAKQTEGVMTVSNELVVDPNVDDDQGGTLFPPAQPTSG